MNGISTFRLALYVVVIAGLLAANAWRLSQGGNPDVAEAITRDATPMRVPKLALSVEDAPVIGTRDLFRAGAAPVPKPVVVQKPEAAPQPQAPDPIEIARDQAAKKLDAVRLIGVVASGEGALAVFAHDGNTVSRVLGDEIVSGFKLDRISQGEIRARHDQLGLVAILSLGGVRPMQMTRVE